MKKILTALLCGAMLLSVASCGGEKLPANKLTDNEVKTIIDELNAMPKAKNLSATMKMNTETGADGVTIKMTADSEIKFNGTEYCSITTTDTGMGKGPTKETEYFKDGKLYTISSDDNGVSGYYEEKTYEEVIGADDTVDEIGVTENMLKNATVERKDGKIVITPAADDLDVKKLLGDEFDASDLERSEFTLTVTDKYKFSSLALKVTGTSEEGSVNVETELTALSYGDEAVAITAPDNLDVCVPYEEYMEDEEDEDIDWGDEDEDIFDEEDEEFDWSALDELLA